jgi:hypothetical protein
MEASFTRTRIPGMLLVAILSVLTACSKYDDGPFLSLYSKGARVGGKWTFSRVYVDGADSTERFYSQRIDFIFTREEEENLFLWYTNLAATAPTPDNPRMGRWAFIADKDSFQLTIYDRIVMDSVSEHWKINRLSYTDFWLERTNEQGHFIEWKLFKSLYAY